MRSYNRPIHILKDAGGTQISTHRYEFQAVAAAEALGTATYILERPDTTFITGDAVTDITAPVVTLIGSASSTLYTDSVYTEEGATAFDETDGILPVVLTGSVDTSINGIYAVTYTATDAAGNSGSATRTVTVETAPVTGADNFYMVAPSGTYTVYPDVPFEITYEDAAYCYASVVPADNVGPVSFAWLSETHTENTAPFHMNGDNVTAAFPTGTNTIVVTTLSGTFNIILEVATIGVDVVAPTITLNGWNPVYIDTGGSYNELGGSAWDFADPSPSLVVSGTVNTAVAGTYTVTYTATDASSNESTATRSVIVADAPTGTATVNISSLTVPPESLMYGRTFEVNDPIDYNTNARKASGGYAAVSIDSLGVPTITGDYGIYDIVATWTNQTTTTPEAL